MKRVGMFVWNHFTNDARVLRECTTLSQNGYDVELICIHDPDDPTLERYEEVNEHFRVYRLKRDPIIFSILLKTYQLTVTKKWLLIPLLFVLGAICYVSPWIFLSLLIVTGSLFISKIRVPITYSTLILKMIIKGYIGNYDIYHSNDLNTLPQGYITSKWRLKKRPLIYDSHEVQTSRTGYDSPWFKRIEGFLIKKVDSMMVENHTRANYNERLYGFYPHVLHNYPSLEIQKVHETIDLHKILGLPEKEKILLYQGGIQPGRGLENLVEAFPLFKEGTLVFIGDGKIKGKLQQMVKKRELEDGIRFINKVPIKDLPKYTKNAYLGFQVLNNVCFNHWSASSNKLFEYMMNEVPIVACNFPEIKRAVEDSEVGVTIDPHDPAEIARGVNYLLDNPDKRDYFSNNCKKARKKYNWEIEQKNLLEVYRDY
ncbi:glycosyltransferase involved in cell wall biosynthesis [Pseudogracilibacillus auburnensis]|uniref:Glycosyltransferase involved in cell wall biosynthesis n=2 Tax=Pseudogracilibacillus auburnensis TaxID=1494959 RepID=A0A2V3VW22_9BACI|nr:glycosyltransferase involved in cell wall biosynthesis [Pseudogracilibacillus auburnensis]